GIAVLLSGTEEQSGHETGKSEIRKEALHSRSDVFHAFGVAGRSGNALCNGCRNDAIKKWGAEPLPDQKKDV
ncbi:hypothetical protein NAK62_005311, partial [Escherichia coli]|nr:hypothetical protein [Escherichia coli]